MIPEIWLAVFITGGKSNGLAASLYPSKEQCVASLSITESEWPGFPYGRWDGGKPINGFCIKVDDAVVTKPKTLREIMGIESPSGDGK